MTRYDHLRVFAAESEGASGTATDLSGSEGASSNPKAFAPSASPSDAPAKSKIDKAAQVADLLRGLDAEGNLPKEGTEEEAEEKGEAKTGSLEDLLGDQSHGEPAKEGAEEGTGEGEGAKAPKTLSDLSEALKLDDSKIYDIEVPTLDGKTATLGKMKDAYLKRDELEAEIAFKQSDLNDREVSIYQEHQLMGEIGDQIRKFTTPEQQQQLMDRRRDKAINERAALARSAPELSNAQSFASFQRDAIKLAGQYGFKPHEVIIDDHRQMLVLRGFLKSLKVISDLKKFKPKPKLPEKSQSKGRKVPSSKASQAIAKGKGGSRAQQVAAVAALIKGG